MKGAQATGDWDFKAAYKNTWLLVCAFELCMEGRLTPEDVQRFYEYKIYGLSFAQIGRMHNGLSRVSIRKSCDKVERYCEARVRRYEDRSNPKNVKYSMCSKMFVPVCKPVFGNSRANLLSEVKIEQLGFTPPVQQELLDRDITSFWDVANKINGNKCKLYDRVKESEKKTVGKDEKTNSVDDEEKKTYVSARAKKELVPLVNDYIQYSRKSDFRIKR